LPYSECAESNITFLIFVNRILPDAKFTLRPSLAFSYIGSEVTARHSNSVRRASTKLCGV